MCEKHPPQYIALTYDKRVIESRIAERGVYSDHFWEQFPCFVEDKG